MLTDDPQQRSVVLVDDTHRRGGRDAAHLVVVRGEQHLRVCHGETVRRAEGAGATAFRLANVRGRPGGPATVVCEAPRAGKPRRPPGVAAEGRRRGGRTPGPRPVRRTPFDVPFTESADAIAHSERLRGNNRILSSIESA
ncbi:hypothetical protein GCM10022207_56120 [Streptomyces lannensis]|uniref:Uncharacterized protein n=1 Tax=Streptomyces lannensis TaxID=766498 RepID=A0ABP7KPS5_9ACTN